MVTKTSPAQTNSTAPEFLDPKQFAELAALSLSHVYRMVKLGEIPHKKYGRTIRIPRSELVVTQGQ